MPAEVIIYHNPSCSKSRQTLKLLEESNLNINIIKYLDTPPDAEMLKHILAYLNIDDPRDLMRKHESEYQTYQLSNPQLTRDELILAMVKHPRLIERPIVINGQKAAIGRPPESVLSII